MDTFLRELRIAGRTLRNRPAFTLTVVAVLALGIGASSAIFGIIEATLLRPLPFREPGRLVLLWGTFGPQHDIRGGSYPEVMDWRAQTRSFEDVSIYDAASLSLSGVGEASQVRSETVSPGYFSMLGVKPALGRAFTAREAEAGTEPVAMISYDLWRTRFGGDPAILGRAIRLEGKAFTVVGVLPRGFRGLSFEAQVWTTLASLDPGALTGRGARWLGAVGRIRPGVTRAAAAADVAAVARRLEALYPAINRDRGVILRSLHEFYLNDTRVLLLVVLGAVLILLLIACGNVMNLQLVRGAARTREIAIRHALGAGRSRLLRQLLLESLLLAGAGAAAGLLLADWGGRLLVPLVPDGILPPYAVVRLDAGVVAFTVALAAASGILFGLVPALRSVGARLSASLRDGGRTTTGGQRRGFGLQHALVVVEVALAVVLLVGAGLLIRSFQQQLKVEVGFRPEGLLAASLELPRSSYDAAGRRRFAAELLDRLRSHPQIADVALASDAPLRGHWTAQTLQRDGFPEDHLRVYWHAVTPSFFATLGVPIRAGRGLEARDVDAAAGVVVVSQAMARRLWPAGDAVGQRLRFGGSQEADVATVVGVARDVRHRDLTSSLTSPAQDPDLYVAYDQLPTSSLEILVRSAADPAELTALIRRDVAALDPSLPVYRAAPLTAALALQTANERFGSLLLALFSGLALVLAATGIYGVMAFQVGLRTREIAIRLAVGAAPRAVRLMVLRQGAGLAALGIALGVPLAAAAARTFAAVLYGVTPTDRPTFAAVVAFVLLVTLAANLLPAQRATAVDPQAALRAE
ncbi:MAG TPA: ABC transporter permease [Longimicrobiales bacterium]|nr:ABC transporter permease [Longimicrobiales bacterium]